MKHSLETDDATGIFLVITEGNGDAAGIIAFLDDIVSHPSWKPGRGVLLDHRLLRIDGIDPEGVEQVSHHFRTLGRRLGNGRIALVMKRAVDFGIARAWQQMTEDHVAMEIQIFHSMAKAREWLGIH